MKFSIFALASVLLPYLASTSSALTVRGEKSSDLRFDNDPEGSPHELSGDKGNKVSKSANDGKKGEKPTVVPAEDYQKHYLVSGQKMGY
jgi:hypothetical protein